MGLDEALASTSLLGTGMVSALDCQNVLFFLTEKQLQQLAKELQDKEKNRQTKVAYMSDQAYDSLLVDVRQFAEYMVTELIDRFRKLVRIAPPGNCKNENKTAFNYRTDFLHYLLQSL